MCHTLPDDIMLSACCLRGLAQVTTWVLVPYLALPTAKGTAGHHSLPAAHPDHPQPPEPPVGEDGEAADAGEENAPASDDLSLDDSPAGPPVLEEPAEGDGSDPPAIPIPCGGCGDWRTTSET